MDKEIQYCDINLPKIDHFTSYDPPPPLKKIQKHFQ